MGQLSYVVLGAALLAPLSILGAYFHIVAHALMKITLFMCAGAIIVTAHKDNISDMHGIGRKMPITMACYTIASLGIAGPIQHKTTGPLWKKPSGVSNCPVSWQSRKTQ